MLQLAILREQKEEIIQRLAIKNFDAKDVVDQVLNLDSDKRKTQQELDTLLSEQNVLAKQIGDLYKSGKKNGSRRFKIQKLCN